MIGTPDTCQECGAILTVTGHLSGCPYLVPEGVKTMDEKSKIAVEGRKLNENLANMTAAGVKKGMAKWHRSLYVAYVTEGFLPDQAMALVIAHIQTPSKTD